MVRPSTPGSSSSMRTWASRSYQPTAITSSRSARCSAPSFARIWSQASGPPRAETYARMSANVRPLTFATNQPYHSQPLERVRQPGVAFTTAARVTRADVLGAHLLEHAAEVGREELAQPLGRVRVSDEIAEGPSREPVVDGDHPVPGVVEARPELVEPRE